jgi:hypothetical protein
VFILLVVEVVKVEKVGLLGLLHRPQAVHDGDGVHGNTVRSVSVEGANVMITSFGDFASFRRKKWAFFFKKNNALVHIF